MESNFICHNGKFCRADELNIGSKNRGFCYGDGLFETIHCMGTSPQFISHHWQRLKLGMDFLKMNYEQTISEEVVTRYIEKLLNKNRLFKGARIRLAVYRNEGGLYSPSDNGVSWLMESSALPYEKYELNKKGLVMEIFDGLIKPVNALSNLKSANALIYVLAGIFRKEHNLDDCFILNQYGRIAESGYSNLFFLWNDKLITPPLSEGGIAGTMRLTIIKLAKEAGYEVEERIVSEKHLLESEEVFTCNAIQGIQWVGTYKDKRYFNFVSRKLIKSLNDLAFGD